MDHGGVGRYGRLLIDGLRRLPDGPSLEVVERGAGRSWAAAPFTPWARARVGRRARTSRADVLHSLHLELPRVEIPCVVTIHDLIPIEVEGAMPSRVRRAVFRRLLETALERATKVIVPSEVTRASLARSYGSTDAKVVVIPNAVDPVFVPLDEGKRDEARRRFASGARYVAAMSDARTHKAPDVLGEAARRIVDAGTSVVFAGEPRVVFTSFPQAGALSDRDLALFLGGADLFLLPSRLEGFGLPLAEAAACGVPGIASTGVGAVSYLGDGVLVVAAEGEEVAEAALSLLGEESERLRRSGAALGSAAALSVDALARATDQVYASLLR